jgi:hypothetical protein
MMKLTSRGASPSTIAQTLKIAGIVLIVLFLIDCISLTLSPNLFDSQWVTNWITQIVDRGIVSMVGIALLLTGIGVSSNSKPVPTKKRSRPNLLTMTLLFSGLLSIVFLVFAPLYFNNSRLISAEVSRQINEETLRAESNLDSQLNQQRDQVNALLSNDEQLKQLEQQLQDGQLTEAMRAQIQQIKNNIQQAKANPNFLEQRIEGLREQGLSQIRQAQLQTKSQVVAEIRKSQFRITVSSLLLSLGYFGICWTGTSVTRRKSQAVAASIR